MILRLSALARPLILARPRLVLALFCALLWSPGFFSLPPGDRDESRFAEATRQMTETGDYIRILNGQVARNKKPIGIHWLQAPFVLAADAAGLARENPIWPYRIPSALGGLAAVLATYEIAGRLGADRRQALLAGAMLAASVILVTETHIAKTDAALLGTITVAMAGLAQAWIAPDTMRRRQAVLFWLALGLGVLIKGPIAPMVVGLAAATLAVAARRGRWLLALRPIWGFPLMLALVLPWFVAITLVSHGAFLSQSVGDDLGRKLATGTESHGGFLGEHLLLMGVLAFPSAIFVLRALPAAWASRREKAGAFLLAWLIPSWLVFEAVPTKLPHYPLPLYPALFLIAAIGGMAGPRAIPRWWAWITAALAALVPLGLGLAAGWAPITLGAPWYLGLAAIPVAAVSAWAGFTARPLLSLAAAVPLYAVILQGILPNIEALWIAPRLEAALKRDWPAWNKQGSGLVVAGDAEPSLLFLAGPQTLFLPDGALAARALGAGSSTLAVVSDREQSAFVAAAKQLGLAPRPAETIAGYNYSKGRRVSLTLYAK